MRSCRAWFSSTVNMRKRKMWVLRGAPEVLLNLRGRLLWSLPIVCYLMKLQALDSSLIAVLNQ